jgi:hypothetical protein
MDLEKSKMGKGGEHIDFCSVLAEEFDSSDAVGVEDIVDVVGEVVADGCGWDCDAGRPLFDELLDVEKAVVARGLKVFSELSYGEVGISEGFGADGPNGGDPGKVGAGAPLMGQVEPLTRADVGFDVLAGFECEESGIADEDGRVCVLQHGDWVGCGGYKGGLGVVEFTEEDLGVGEGTAGGGIGGNGFYSVEGVWGFDDELDGTDFVERGDGAAGDDGEFGREGCDGDEAEVRAGGEEFVCTARWKCVVEGVALDEFGGERRVFEVPHEGSGIEEVDGGDAERSDW